MLDYQTNTEGAGFFYKTDRVPIDTWQLWEHHKHDPARSASKNHLTRSKCKFKIEYFIFEKTLFVFLIQLVLTVRVHRIRLLHPQPVHLHLPVIHAIMIVEVVVDD